MRTVQRYRTMRFYRLGATVLTLPDDPDMPDRVQPQPTAIVQPQLTAIEVFNQNGTSRVVQLLKYAASQVFASAECRNEVGRDIVLRGMHASLKRDGMKAVTDPSWYEGEYATQYLVAVEVPRPRGIRSAARPW